MRATERGDDSDTGGAGGDAEAAGDGSTRLPRWYPLALALAGSVAVLVANVGGIAIGDDGTGYQATADSLLAGDGLGYFLERPLTVWPPVWPWLMAAVAKVTPLDTLGAAVALNVVMTFLAVIVGHRLLVRVVRQERLVLLGTAVIALGSSTIGFGHLLMTDFAFGVLIMVWILALLNFQASGRWAFLLAAAGLVWVGFGLRYVGIVLVGIGGLWLLLDREHRVLLRVRNAAVFGVVSILAPVAWMARNHSVDGTYTGERFPSARGLFDNGFDILATLGRFLLPGVGNGFTKIWAVVGGVVLVVAAWLGWKVSMATRRPGESVVARKLRLVGGPVGLLLLMSFGYLLYMLYVRTTTALNQLDLRLLNPAYLSLLVAALALIAHLRDLGPEPGNRWWPRGLAVAHVWAVANIAAGMVAMVGFAAGNPYFDGNYNSDTFRDVRDNPALDALPDGLPGGVEPAQRPLPDGGGGVEPAPDRAGVERAGGRPGPAHPHAGGPAGVPGLDRRATRLRTPLDPGRVAGPAGRAGPGRTGRRLGVRAHGRLLRPVPAERHTDDRSMTRRRRRCGSAVRRGPWPTMWSCVHDSAW